MHGRRLLSCLMGPHTDAVYGRRLQEAPAALVLDQVQDQVPT